MKWNAKWIWLDLPVNTPNVYMEARRTFQVSETFTKAQLRISANQEYKLFINGDYVGRGPNPSDIEWQYYDTYNVENILVTGSNVIAIVVYNFGTTDIVTDQYQGPGGLIAQLDIEMGGSSLEIGTDHQWRVRRSPRWHEAVTRQHQWNKFREVYLAAHEDGWETCAFDDSSWAQATIAASAEQADSAWPRLLASDIPFLQETVIQPVSIIRTEQNLGIVDGAATVIEDSIQTNLSFDATKPYALPAVVYDFERVVVGYVEIEVDAPQGGTLQCSYGESLQLALYDTFILKPGINRLSVFDRRAFRFVQLSAQATPMPIKVTSFQLRMVHYPFEQTGTFQSNDKLLNEIWQVGEYTTRVNSQNHLEDCPLRERALWVVDAVVMGKVIYHVYGDRALLRKCLLQSARIQNEDGSIPGTGPEKNRMLLPDFCAHWLFGTTDYYHYTNDSNFLDEVWPHLTRLMEWFAAQEDKTGLFAKADRPGMWCFVDWADYLDKRDRVTAISCFYYRALLCAADLADIREEQELAQSWRDKARLLKHQIRAQLWSEEHHAYADCLTDEGLSEKISLQTNFVAAWTGIMTRDESLDFVERHFINGDLPALKGAFFYHIVLEVLFDLGYGEQALEKIREYWGAMLARGATTWWETFDPASSACTIPSPYQGNTPTYLMDHIPVSFCHGWGASPNYLLTQRLLGVDVFQMGDGIVHLAPRTELADEVSGTVPTPHGEIAVEWRRVSNKVIYHAKVPRGLHIIQDFSDEVDVTIERI